MSKLKKIPKFKSEKAEEQFWQEHDSADYIDWSKAKEAVFPNLKPSTRTISIRLPESLFYELKVLANKDDIPYQSLIKLILIQAMNCQHKAKKHR
jgi:predicted DNA binding CopG/RHH family protein